MATTKLGFLIPNPEHQAILEIANALHHQLGVAPGQEPGELRKQRRDNF
jgi:hypothetical protein